MTDETKPKRQRGQREREAAYLAGFLAGLEHALTEMRAERDKLQARDLAIRDGLALLCEVPIVKRTRRKRSNGVSANPDVVTVA